MKPLAITILFLVAGLVLSPGPTRAGDLGFEDVTSACGLGDKGGDRFAFGDYDGDGDPDLLVNASRLYRNDSAKGTIRFTDVTGEAALEGAGGGGACFVDFDRDGHLDIVTNSLQVWLGSAEGTFENVAKKLGATLPGGPAASIGVGDIDGDGWVDIVTGGAEAGKPRRLLEQTVWLNKRGEKLENATQKIGLGEQQYGRAMIFCDYDWDGDADLYGGHYRLRPNALYRNDGGKLENVAVAAGVTGRSDPEMFEDAHTGRKYGYHYGHTIGASWADLNNDGLFDLWVSNLAHKAIGKVSADFAKLLGTDYDIRGYLCDDSNVFINQGAPDWDFEDERATRGIPIVPVEKYGVWRGDELWSNAACGDADNNGWIDVYVNQVYGSQPNSFALLFLNDGGTFEEQHSEFPTALWGGYGSAWADLDSDGWLDLVAGGAPACHGKRRIHVFQNRARGRDWIGFDLVATKKTPTVGARVLLVQERATQVRQVETTMGSHTQQNDPRLHFGLGDGGKILDVVVTWPDGRIQSLGRPKANRYHEVKQARKRTAPRLEGVTCDAARVGEAAELRAAGSAKGTWYWSFDGSRRVDAVTKVPTVTHVFETEGTHHGRVRLVRSGAVAEVAFAVEVK